LANELKPFSFPNGVAVVSSFGTFTPAMDSKRYFTRTDWLAFLITVAVSFGVYLYTLAPNVTLEDSGEFLTAGYSWGVPHPPGYPIWTISINLFERLIPYGNAAWRGNLMSAFYGALAAGIWALIACKLASRMWTAENQQEISIDGSRNSLEDALNGLVARLRHWLIQSIEVWKESPEIQSRLSLTAGVVAGLVFAFIDTVWTQAVITEVYTLNSFFFTFLCLLVMRWFDEPERWRWPALIALFFGLGITNHHTLLVTAPAFTFAMFHIDRTLYRDTAMIGAIGCAIFAWQARLWFMWIGAIGFLLHYLWLMAEEPDARTLRSLFTFLFALLVGTLIVTGLCIWNGETASLTAWIYADLVLLVICVFMLSYFVTHHLLSGAINIAQALPFLMGTACLLGGGGWWFCESQLAARSSNPASAMALTILGFFLFLLGYGVASRSAARNQSPHIAGRYVLCGLMLFLGASVYLYMPLSSATNPPMNWGYTQTVEGFRHHILREQYEPLRTGRSPSVLMEQYAQFFNDLRENFTLPLTFLAALPLFFVLVFREREKNYLVFTILCFFFTGLLLVYLLNPKFDEQSRFVNRVFYSLAHCSYALWIGLGAALLPGVARRLKRLGALLAVTLLLAFLACTGHQLAVHGYPWGALLTLTMGTLCGTCMYFLGLVLLQRFSPSQVPTLIALHMLPLLPFTMNWSDANMHSNNLGWRYGHDMLKNLDKDAVVYGGTDPGRFVPTYMIFVESFQPREWRADPAFDRRDLYIITQNALADQTYMKYIRDHYDVTRPKMDQWYHRWLGRDSTYPKEPLRLPNEEEFNVIFSRVVEQSRNNPSSGVVFEKDASGRMRATVRGIEGVFAINAEVARWIFEHNKAKHSFYVEESYPILWMYPYLEPCGLIMKLNASPLPSLDPKVVQQDMVYWKKLCADLLGNQCFLDDIVARRSFSKLRSSIAGVYTYRQMLPEAERALREAMDLCPSSGEARARIIELFLGQERYSEATHICQEWINLDPRNPGVWQATKRVEQVKALAAKEAELASLYEFNKNDSNFIFQYAAVLYDRGKVAESDKAVDTFLDGKEFNLVAWQTAINLVTKSQRIDRVESLLSRLTSRDAKNALAWYNLGIVQAILSKKEAAIVSLGKALHLDTNLCNQARQDENLKNLQPLEQFQKLLRGEFTPTPPPFAQREPRKKK
jgi:tetratricopeptide (TPR) repeat protein